MMLGIITNYASIIIMIYLAVGVLAVGCIGNWQNFKKGENV